MSFKFNGNTSQENLFQQVAFGRSKPQCQSKEVMRTLPKKGTENELAEYLVRNQKKIEQEVEAIIAPLNADHLLKHGSPMSGKKKESLRAEVRKKYRQQYAIFLDQTIIWDKSEEILEILRTKGVYDEPDQAAKALAFTRLHERVQEFAPKDTFDLSQQELVAGPNQYFVETYPELVRKYGYPFYSMIPERPEPYLPPSWQKIPPRVERITGINTGFWGAFLGGDKRLGHDVIFYLPEDRFYFYDPVVDCYVPTSENKLHVYLSLLWQEQARGKELEASAPLLEQFTSKTVFNEIVAKAKATLAAEKGFFCGSQAKKKWGVQQEEASLSSVSSSAIAFVKEWIEPAEGVILACQDCVERFKEYFVESDVPKSQLKAQIEEVIRQVHGKKIRNDLIRPDGSGVAGWKGFRLRARS